MSARRGAANAAAGAVGCLVILVILAIKGAVLVGAVWLVVWALRSVGAQP